MAILEKSEFVWPEGVTPVDFETWITTLSQADQDEFARIEAQMESDLQKYIDSGDLVRTPDGNRWTSETIRLQARREGVPDYFLRWISENNIKYQLVTTEI